MKVDSILEEIESQGLRATVCKGVLLLGPGDKVSDELRELVKSNMARLLAHYAGVGDKDVQWRVAAMLEHLLPLQWPCPIPFLWALPDAGLSKENCKSCDALLDVGEGDSYICGACARAKDIALSLWMQRPAQSVRAA